MLSNFNIGQTPNQVGDWFDNLVATIRSHEIQIESDVASNDIKDYYNNLIKGNAHAILADAKARVQQFFVTNIVLEFLGKIKGDKLLKLAVDHNDSEVFVWAEIDDENEALEDKLIMAEAAVNSKYHQYGFDMTTTIVEKSDLLPTPPHYKTIFPQPIGAV